MVKWELMHSRSISVGNLALSSESCTFWGERGTVLLFFFRQIGIFFLYSGLTHNKWLISSNTGKSHYSKVSFTNMDASYFGRDMGLWKDRSHLKHFESFGHGAKCSLKKIRVFVSYAFSPYPFSTHCVVVVNKWLPLCVVRWHIWKSRKG